MSAPDSRFRFSASLSVFFPAYNDASALPSLLDRTFETLRRVVVDYEVIVVNDGSSDNTAELLEELRKKYAPLLRVVTHDRNRGYGAALRSGFAAASKEYIFYTDGDGQYDPAELENLLRAATPAADLVNGYKLERSDPWHRIAIGWLYNTFARWLFRIRVRDIDCDFRLIRRSALDLGELHSTGGTICIELVRAMELSANQVVEIPVHHYARTYGRSQFFRIRSLAMTFLQLGRVFFQLVIAPALTGAGGPKQNQRPRLSPRRLFAAALGVVSLAALAYAPALQLPFIGDDYLQIHLARQYGAISNFWAVLQDASYRHRATSLLLTYWLNRAAGLDAFYYNVASLLLHMLDSLLVLALGLWRPVGWRVAALAACFFAVSQRHSEAVLWFAALPELLVFFFVLAAFLLWIRWLDGQAGPRLLYVGAFGCYLLALLSKESAVAVVPLLALAVWCHPRRPLMKLWGLAPFVAMAVVDLSSMPGARGTHPAFYDQSFSLSAPFAQTMVRGLIGLFAGVWGAVSLPMLLTGAARRRRNFFVFTGAWVVFTLLPYSFQTHAPGVPSRNTYLASVGLALVVATALLALWEYSRRWKQSWLMPVAALAMIAHQCEYQWTVKYQQYFRRALPTEELIQIAASTGREIHAKCFPYSPLIANLALQLRLGETSHPAFVIGDMAAQQPDAVDFCNADADGLHY